MRQAWGRRRLDRGGHHVFIDKDYPIKILPKRRKYAEVKEVLKEKGIRFQTPWPTRMQVHFLVGETTVYEMAAESAAALREKGLTEVRVQGRESRVESLVRTARELITVLREEEAQTQQKHLNGDTLFVSNIG